MPGKYNRMIESYCERRGIHIPIGFGKGNAQRYAIILLDSDRPQLVAKTWFNMEDVVYYLRNVAGDRLTRVLDFKDGVELVDKGGKRLKRGQPIDKT